MDASWKANIWVYSCLCNTLNYGKIACGCPISNFSVDIAIFTPEYIAWGRNLLRRGFRCRNRKIYFHWCNKLKEILWICVLSKDTRFLFSFIKSIKMVRKKWNYNWNKLGSYFESILKTLFATEFKDNRCLNIYCTCSVTP